MKSYLLFCLIILGTVAFAQETATPQLELGANYSYTRINPGAGLSSYGANGGYGDIEYNFSSNFGFVTELGGSYSYLVHGISVNDITFEYLFGPRFNIRHGRFNPYLQTLFGGQRFSNGFNPGGSNPFLNASQNDFTMALGGGLNIAVSNHVSVRAFQVDYFPVEIATSNHLQNNLRASAGFVFRLGSK
jgi:outer membrane immunogenic protein